VAAADGDVIGTQAKPDPVIQVTAVILAGGMARRMGGLDKGLIELAGRPMVAHIHRAIAPQVRAVVINANRNLDAYAALGTAVVPDALTGFQGPLAGMASGLRAAHTDWILTLPCDSPFVPPDMADRMCAALLEQAAELAVASDGQRLQPVFALLSRSLLPSLDAFLGEGERKIDRWFARHRMATVSFADHPDAFINVNTPEQRAAVEAQLGAAL
jgi:molybdopterin-guanine dinucleotide biosynthesis protein A